MKRTPACRCRCATRCRQKKLSAPLPRKTVELIGEVVGKKLRLLRIDARTAEAARSESGSARGSRAEHGEQSQRHSCASLALRRQERFERQQPRVNRTQRGEVGVVPFAAKPPE